MKWLSLGIMQGRLTPAKGRGIQFFPFENWKEEFEKSAKLGLDEIEWIFDYDQYDKNPLWTEAGCAGIRDMIDRTGIRVHSVCFDYFMRRPFFKCQEDMERMKEENRRLLETVIEHMRLVGASLIEIPLVDGSAIKNEGEKAAAADFIRELAGYAEAKEIGIGLETDLPPRLFRNFIETISRKNVYANYDSGNSSGIGYDHTEEILSLSSLIANVHIKDRKLHGSTVALGQGNADFDKVFSALHAVGYQGSFILQAARSADGTEMDNIKEQAAFVRAYCDRYHVVEI